MDTKERIYRGNHLDTKERMRDLGDALNDMPVEYTEYVQKYRAGYVKTIETAEEPRSEKDHALPYYPWVMSYEVIIDGRPLLRKDCPSIHFCPDCDNLLEERSMPDGIEEWCPVCNVKVEIIPEEERVRIDLLKALDGGYKICAELKPEAYIYLYKMREPHTTRHIGIVKQVGVDVVDI